VFLTQKIIALYFQFIENQWFISRNIALACYPLALQTLSASLLNFVNLYQVLFNEKVGCALSDFWFTLTYRDATKTQQEPCPPVPNGTFGRGAKV